MATIYKFKKLKVLFKDITKNKMYLFDDLQCQRNRKSYNVWNMKKLMTESCHNKICSMIMYKII